MKRKPPPKFRVFSARCPKCRSTDTKIDLLAAVVFPFGPMLIVFGMCFLGSLSMLLFELADCRRFAAATVRM
jgi:hypothetical protein